MRITQKATKSTSSRKIALRADGALIINGRSYTTLDLVRFLDSLLKRVSEIPRTTAANFPGRADRLQAAIEWRIAANRKELYRRLNTLYLELRGNGYSDCAASSVVTPLRRRVKANFESFDAAAAA